jgi:hypothetical protein
MASDPGWARTGRAYAWLGAEGFLVGAVILLLLNLGVVGGPAEPGLAQYVSNTWLLVLGSGVLLLGMLALIPVGLALRELLGRGVGPELMATCFLAGSLLGVSSRLLLIPIRLSLASLAGTRGVQPQILNSFLLTYTMVENATNWLLYGWFLLTGLALYHASRSAMRQGVLPRAWSWMGLVSAVGCWLVVLLTLATLFTNAPAVFMAGRLSMAAVGVVLVPAWLTWLGRELGVALRRDRAAAAPEELGGRGTRPAVRLPRVSAGAPSWLLRLVGRAPLALEPEAGRRAN